MNNNIVILVLQAIITMRKYQYIQERNTTIVVINIKYACIRNNEVIHDVKN